MHLPSPTHAAHSLQSGIIHACTGRVLASNAYAPRKIGMNYACTPLTAINLAVVLSKKPPKQPSAHSLCLFDASFLASFLSFLFCSTAFFLTHDFPVALSDSFAFTLA